MFCKNCGSRIPDNTRFCGNCGAAVSQSPGQAGVPSSAQEGQGKQRNIKLPAFDLKVRMISGQEFALTRK